VGGGHEIESAAVKVDGFFEVGGRIRDGVLQTGDDVFKTPFQHPRAFSIMGFNRLRTAQLCHQRKCFRACLS